LPAPDMPTKATISPFLTVRVMSLRTSSSDSGYRKDTASKPIRSRKSWRVTAPALSLMVGGVSRMSKTRSTDEIDCWIVFIMRPSCRTGP